MATGWSKKSPAARSPAATARSPASLLTRPSSPADSDAAVAPRASPAPAGCSESPGLGQLVHQGAELQLLEQGQHPGPVVALQAGLFQVEHGGDLAVDGGQALVGAHQRLVLGQGRPPAGGDVVQAGVEALHRLEVRQQALGRLLPDPGDALDVVRGVPGEGLQVGHLGGLQAVPLAHRRRVVEHGLRDAPARGQDAHVLVHQLQGVHVPGDDHRLHPVRRGLPGEGAQDVVRLEAVLLVDGDVEGPHDLAHAPELGAQVVRHAGPVGLVVDRGQVAEGGGGEVEGDGAPAPDGGRPGLSGASR